MRSLTCNDDWHCEFDNSRLLHLMRLPAQKALAHWIDSSPHKFGKYLPEWGKQTLKILTQRRCRWSVARQCHREKSISALADLPGALAYPRRVGQDRWIDR